MRYSTYLTEVLAQCEAGSYFLCHCNKYALDHFMREQPANYIMLEHFHKRFATHMRRICSGSNIARRYFLNLAKLENSSLEYNEEQEVLHSVKIDWLKKQIAVQERKEAKLNKQ